MNQELSGADRSINWLDTWKKMEEVYKKSPEKVKAIGTLIVFGKWINRADSPVGVSNVSVAFLEELLKVATVVPAVNQIERHPCVHILISIELSISEARDRSCLQNDVLAASAEKGIVVTAYSPLGSDNSPLLKNDVVISLAEKYKVSPANILVSFHANTPNVTGQSVKLTVPIDLCVLTLSLVLAKSVTPERIIANKKIIDLTDEDIAALSAIDKTAHFRVCSPTWTGWGSLGFTDIKE